VFLVLFLLVINIKAIGLIMFPLSDFRGISKIGHYPLPNLMLKLYLHV
jgi:hypothetical protein